MANVRDLLGRVPEPLRSAPELSDEVLGFFIRYVVPEIWIRITREARGSVITYNSIKEVLNRWKFPIDEINDRKEFSPPTIDQGAYRQFLLNTASRATGNDVAEEATPLIGKVATWATELALITASQEVQARSEQMIRVRNLLDICKLLPYPLSEIIC